MYSTATRGSKTKEKPEDTIMPCVCVCFHASASGGITVLSGCLCKRPTRFSAVREFYYIWHQRPLGLTDDAIRARVGADVRARRLSRPTTIRW